MDWPVILIRGKKYTRQNCLLKVERISEKDSKDKGREVERRKKKGRGGEGRR